MFVYSFPYKTSDPAVLSKPEVKVGYVANEEEVPSSVGHEKPSEVLSPEQLDAVPNLNSPQDSLIGNSHAPQSPSTGKFYHNYTVCIGITTDRLRGRHYSCERQFGCRQELAYLLQL